jgi:hypothetical protein
MIVLTVLFSASAVSANTPKISSPYFAHPADYDGLYYLVNNPRRYTEGALVLSHSGEPIPPKANEPSAPTLPGFYTSYANQ